MSLVELQTQSHFVAGRGLCLVLWETELRFVKFGEDVKR